MSDLPSSARVAADGTAAARTASYRWRLLIRPALLAAGLVLAGLALRMAPRALDPALLDHFILGHGPRGALLFVAVAAAVCSVGVPRQATAFAGGYAFGTTGGMLLALVAQVAGCLIDFGWARAVARPWAARRLRGRLARFDAFLAAHPFRAVLTLRLLPVGNNLVLNLVAGASGVKLLPFLLASVLGYVPQTLVFALLGAGVGVSRYIQVGLGVALFIASAALGMVLLRAQRRVPP